MRRLILPAAWISALLAILPLIGLAWLLISPPPDPFDGSIPNWKQLLNSSGAFVLLRNSLALSAAVCILSTLCGGWLAWMESRARYPGDRFLLLFSLLDQCPNLANGPNK